MLTAIATIASAVSLIVSALTARSAKRHRPDYERLELIERAVGGLIQAHRARATRPRKRARK